MQRKILVPFFTKTREEFSISIVIYQKDINAIKFLYQIDNNLKDKKGKFYYKP